MNQKLLQEERVIVSPEDYKAIQERIFSARVVEIVAPETAQISIAGMPTAVTGNDIRIENTDNPLDLDVKFAAGAGELRVDADGRLYLEKGDITVAGVKRFPPGDQLKSRKELELKPMPVQDPDLVTIDGKVFRQVPTIKISVSSGAYISFR